MFLSLWRSILNRKPRVAAPLGSKRRVLACRPVVEQLEDRCLPSVVAGFSDFTLGATDDGSSAAVSIGFTANFYGQDFSQVYVNNNGNISIDAALSSWQPTDLAGTTTAVIAPYFADVDTRWGGGTVTYGTGTYEGYAAFGVTWTEVGYYEGNTDKVNTFQVILVDRSDTGAGNFDIVYNYDQVQWEAGDLSGGTAGLGGNSARVGFSSGTGVEGTSYELAGSGVAGSFLDTSTSTGLIHNSLNSSEDGQYVFTIRNGVLVTEVATNQAPSADAGGPYEIAEGTALTLNALASSDPDGDALTYSWDVNGDGVFGDATGASPTLTWTELQALGINDGPATFNVHVQVDDGNGHVVVSSAGALTVTNADPSLTGLAITSPVVENGFATLTGTLADPGTLDSFTLVVDWGDGSTPETFTYAAGTTSFTASHQYLDDHPSGTASDVYTVSVRLADDDLAATTATVGVQVNNAAPQINSLASSAPEVGGVSQGETVTIQANFADLGTLDTFTATIDWGDGTTTSGVVGSGVVNGSHAYTAGGIYTITVTIADDDLGLASSTTTAVVGGVGLHDGVLQIIGTSGNDKVTVNRQGNGVYKVHANFLAGSNFQTFSAAEVQSIVILLGDGNDKATIAGNIRASAFIDGGAGNDHLNGGGGWNVLVGGAGDDKLVGNSSHDILVADSLTQDQTALLAVANDWTSAWVLDLLGATDSSTGKKNGK